MSERAEHRPHPGAAQSTLELSIVVPVSDVRDSAPGQVYLGFEQELVDTGLSFEVIFVLDGPKPAVLRELRELKEKDPRIHIVALNRWFGEATALAVGFDVSQGQWVLTLPPYYQVEPGEVQRLIKEAREADTDLVVAWRYPRIDAFFNRVQSWVFHKLTRVLTGVKYRDVSCGLRVMKRKVVEEVRLYGDLHRFLPLLAYQRGFKVQEIPVRQSPKNVKRRLNAPGVYLRRLLDLLTLFFLFKFTKKPLRFFGLLGSGLFGAGAVIVAYLGLYRLLGFGPIAARPLLVLGVLLIVMGAQLFSIGLLGEIIIFTHARNAKDYEIQEIDE